MTEKNLDRLELRFGSFHAAAVGKLAVGGLLILIIGLFVFYALSLLERGASTGSL